MMVSNEFLGFDALLFALMIRQTSCYYNLPVRGCLLYKYFLSVSTFTQALKITSMLFIPGLNFVRTLNINKLPFHCFHVI